MNSFPTHSKNDGNRQYLLRKFDNTSVRVKFGDLCFVRFWSFLLPQCTFLTKKKNIIRLPRPVVINFKCFVIRTKQTILRSIQYYNLDLGNPKCVPSIQKWFVTGLLRNTGLDQYHINWRKIAPKWKCSLFIWSESTKPFCCRAIQHS